VRDGAHGVWAPRVPTYTAERKPAAAVNRRLRFGPPLRSRHPESTNHTGHRLSGFVLRPVGHQDGAVDVAGDVGGGEHDHVRQLLRGAPARSEGNINALRALAPPPLRPVPKPSRPQPRTPTPRWSRRHSSTEIPKDSYFRIASNFSGHLLREFNAAGYYNNVNILTRTTQQKITDKAAVASALGAAGV
jgi:hypothetical protein